MDQGGSGTGKNAARHDPNVALAARKRVRDHFMQMRNEMTQGARGFLAFFAKQKINGIISSIEADVMTDIEKGQFQNVDAVIAKADKKIESETRVFRNKLELFKEPPLQPRQ